MPRTRATGKAGASSAAKSKTESTSTDSVYTLSPQSSSPPKIFILPKYASSSSSRIVSLPHPRYGRPTRYLVCPDTGDLFEFTRVAAPKSAPRSWLIEHAADDDDDDADHAKAGKDGAREGEKDKQFGIYVTKGAELYIATPFDPLFLVLPALVSCESSKESGKRMYRSCEDHLDGLVGEEEEKLSSTSSRNHSAATIASWSAVRTRLELRMKAICETAEAGDETLYRFSEDKLVSELLAKAKRMSHGPLPQSMEDKFVIRALEAPMVGVKVAPAPADAVSDSEMPTAISVSASVTAKPEVSTTTEATTVTETTELAAITSSEDEVRPAMTASPDIISLQRLTIAFSFLCSSYTAPTLASTLQNTFKSHSSVDLAPLQAYLSRLADLKAEAAARSAVDFTGGTKRGLEEDDLTAERAEKKRRREEEEKRKKAGQSRGVRDLKKVNTTGMKKMSTFFQKKTA